MKKSHSAKELVFSDLGVLILMALGVFILHLLTNGQYGFHRDELAMVDDARTLAWGYVAYPPLTPLIGHLGLALFGPSLGGLRSFSALAMSVVIVLVGLLAGELGGRRKAKFLAAGATAIVPFALIQGALFQYVTFDYLWWVVVAYFTARLLRSENPRWWLAIGAAIGVGMMTKYTMAFLVAGMVGGVMLTKNRRYLKSPWLWGGVALALLITLPHLIWQMQHEFISLQFLSEIHARDVRIGRAEGFLPEQFYATANILTIPLWLAGLYFYFFKQEGRRYSLLGWMYLIPLILFLVTRGRGYYLAAAYPMLLAAGAVVWEEWLAKFAPRMARLAWGITWSAIVLGGVLFATVTLPVAPVNSPVWDVAYELHDSFAEQIGWPELVEAVAGIYSALPEDVQLTTAILAGNYGEAGAINLYGSEYGLPRAISGINSYWEQGYGNPPPETLIVLGFTSSGARRFFEGCKLVGKVTNRYGVLNEETRDYPGIFLCRKPYLPWEEFWKEFRYFG